MMGKNGISEYRIDAVDTNNRTAFDAHVSTLYSALVQDREDLIVYKTDTRSDFVVQLLFSRLMHHDSHLGTSFVHLELNPRMIASYFDQPNKVFYRDFVEQFLKSTRAASCDDSTTVPAVWEWLEHDFDRIFIDWKNRFYIVRQQRIAQGIVAPPPTEPIIDSKANFGHNLARLVKYCAPQLERSGVLLVNIGALPGSIPSLQKQYAKRARSLLYTLLIAADGLRKGIAVPREILALTDEFDDDGLLEQLSGRGSLCV